MRAFSIVILLWTFPAHGHAPELASALAQRVTLEMPSGDRVPVGHCRRAPHGCKSRVGALASYFIDAGARFQVDPWVLAAIAVKESALHPFAVGAIGERGVMQINPRRRYLPRPIRRFFDRADHRSSCQRRLGACQEAFVEYGAQILSRALERCGDLQGALTAYNTGRCEVPGHRYAERVLRERDLLMTIAKGY